MRRLAAVGVAMVLAACGGTPARPAAPAHAAAPATAAASATPAAAPEHAACTLRTLDALLDCRSLHDAPPENGWYEELLGALGDVQQPVPQPRAAPTRGRRGRRAVDPPRFETRPLDETEARAWLAARHVLCAGGVAGQPEVAYRAARVFYAANQVGDATTLFDAVVREAPHSELASFAAMLALDSMNVPQIGAAASDALKTSCRDAMRVFVRDYPALLGCGGGGDEDTCATMEAVRCELLRVDAEKLAYAGDAAGASRLYESAFTTHCGRPDEALFDAAVTAERAGDTARASSLAARLQVEFPDSELAHRRIGP